MRTLLALAVLLVCGRASAHHSFAMYDPAQLVHIVGTVKTFAWTNPHVMVWVVKDDPAGEVWTIELPTSPGNLARSGWSKSTLKAGDKVDVEVNPLRDGQHAGSFKKATLVDTGEVLTAAIAASDGKDAGANASPDPATAGPSCGDTSDESHESVSAVVPGQGCACTEHSFTCAGPALGLALVAGLLAARKLKRAPREA